jgi:hypothetical protein
MRRDRTATAEAVGSHLKRKEASKIVSTESRKASSTSISAEQSKKLASAKARDNAASCEARDSYTGEYLVCDLKAAQDMVLARQVTPIESARVL